MDATKALCSKGCGFYGSPEQHGLCSGCYNDFLREKIAKSSVQASDSFSTIDDLSSSVDKLSIQERTDTATPNIVQGINILTKINTKKPVQNRCNVCDKRVGLLGFECRCGDVFCGTHRYPEEHACDLDYKRRARRNLAEQNPSCVADRMQYRI